MDKASRWGGPDGGRFVCDIYCAHRGGPDGLHDTKRRGSKRDRRSGEAEPSRAKLLAHLPQQTPREEKGATRCGAQCEVPGKGGAWEKGGFGGGVCGSTAGKNPDTDGHPDTDGKGTGPGESTACASSRQATCLPGCSCLLGASGSGQTARVPPKHMLLPDGQRVGSRPVEPSLGRGLKPFLCRVRAQGLRSSGV